MRTAASTAHNSLLLTTAVTLWFRLHSFALCPVLPDVLDSLFRAGCLCRERINKLKNLN